MSTRRDRAAQAIADAIWGDEYAGWLDVDKDEAYRIADLVLAEVDRIPDVSEFEELMDRSSLGTPEAKAAIASVPDRVAQRAIDFANRMRDEHGDDTEDGVVFDATCPHCQAALKSEGRAAQPPVAPQTDDEGGTPPADVTNPAAAESATGALTPEPPSSSALRFQSPWDGILLRGAVLPKPFLLWRHRDVTGLSGIGIVAWGSEWPDGSVSLRWATEHKSTVHWDSIDDLLAVHGHGGETTICWLKASLYPGEA